MITALLAFTILPHAHSHNDYEQKRPLLDALDNGFTSIEADIFLVDGELQVGHTRGALKQGRTLESLYLDPLAAKVKANGGTVYGQPGMVILLVDIKEDGAKVQDELNRRLPKYREMLTERTGNTVQTRAVQIILSGARTNDCASAEGFLFKDGGPGDLTDNAARTPLISTSYIDLTGTFKTPVEGEGRKKVEALVAAAHKNGMKVRLWEAPDNETAWKDLLALQLDLVNTDHLPLLRQFFLDQPK